MKRNTTQHPKMHALAERLGVAHAHAIGIITLLWEYAANNTPRGDIGRVPDKILADRLGWPARKSGLLVTSLVESGWLDRDDDHRLIVHDWAEHCEYEVCRSLQRAGKDFLPQYQISIYDRGKNATKPRAASGSSAASPRENRAPRGAEATAMADGENIKETTLPSTLTVVDSREKATQEAVQIVTDVAELYRMGGKPVPEEHKELAVRVLLNRPAGSRHRLRDYVAWAFASGQWPTSAKTKSLHNLIRDGDWDVDVTPRVLPTPVGGQGTPSAQSIAAGQFRAQMAREGRA